LASDIEDEVLLFLLPRLGGGIYTDPLASFTSGYLEDYVRAGIVEALASIKTSSYTSLLRDIIQSMIIQLIVK